MLFKTKDFYVDLAEYKDVGKITKVYNSNTEFLISHMDKEYVTDEWVNQELKSMKEAGFHSCKIVEEGSERIIGIIDFKSGIESYLSLLMFHNDFKSKGLGKLILDSLEEYAKTQKSKCIRIDVVTNYNSYVIDFWSKRGFIKTKDIELNWTGKVLPAITMKKDL